jgi:hypothetical protein
VRYQRAYRYAVPAAIAAAIGAAVGLPELSGAASAPSLPPKTPAELLAEVGGAKAPALSGTLTWTANLGLLGLSTLEGELSGGTTSGDASAGFSPLRLLAGTYEMDVWMDGAMAQRFSFSDSPTEEYDFVHDLGQAWLWDSTNQTVTHLVFQGRGATPAADGYSPPTPQQVASELLARVSATTSVTSAPPTYVAGQPAYQLVVAPKGAPGTTVDELVVDIGANGELAGVPLEVTVYAKGQGVPALQLGFTGSLHLGVPPLSELTFTAPPGAKVLTHYLQVGSGTSPQTGGLSGLQRLGKGWASAVTGTAPQLDSPSAQASLAPITSAVEVAGQQARLLSTDLLNVLIMPGGRFYAGFVAPSVLEADASANLGASTSS